MKRSTSKFLLVVTLCIVQLWLSLKHIEIYPGLTYPKFAKVNALNLEKVKTANEADYYLTRTLLSNNITDSTEYYYTYFLDSNLQVEHLIDYQPPNPWALNLEFEVVMGENQYSFPAWKVFETLDLPNNAKSKYIPIYCFYDFPYQQSTNGYTYTIKNIVEISRFLRARINELLVQKGVTEDWYRTININWFYKANKELAKGIKLRIKN